MCPATRPLASSTQGISPMDLGSSFLLGPPQEESLVHIGPLRWMESGLLSIVS